MNEEKKPSLEERVVRAAEAALEDHQYVSAIDVLTGIRLLEPVNVERWRHGRIPYLEDLIQGRPHKLARSLEILQQWAESRGLLRTEAQYRRPSRAGEAELRFTESGDPQLEQAYRAQYVSPLLSEKKVEKLQERANRLPERVVYQILRDSSCSECGAELPKESFLMMDGEQALCLQCAGLGELEFLPSGDTALTRRANKYSGLSAVVVRFSRSRKRYERQGILVEEEALRRAEEETRADAPERARRRALAAAGRREEDKQFVGEMTRRIRELFPRCPPAEARAIAAHAAERGSGRIGRSAVGRALREEAVTLAVRAAVRHNHTNYDTLLAQGMDRSFARAKVRERVDDILDAWSETTEGSRNPA